MAYLNRILNYKNCNFIEHLTLNTLAATRPTPDGLLIYFQITTFWNVNSPIPDLEKMALEVFIFWNYFFQFSNNVVKQFA